MLAVSPVANRQDLQAFLDLPERLYPSLGLPWAPPLRLHLRMMMGALTGPERGFFVAREDGRPVGRIGARVHHSPGRSFLHFGFFETIPGRPEAAAQLLAAVQSLAPGLPLRGPMQFTQEDFYTGLLVKGFESPPCWGMAFNPEYYDDYLQAAGCRPLKDLESYRITWADYRPGLLEPRAQRARERGVTVRSLNPRRRWADILATIEVMNRSLRDNWGFEPFGPTQARELWLLSWLFLDTRWLLLALREGQALGTGIALPDFNPWLVESRGRLTPRLLWRMLFSKRKLTGLRGWALGVLPEARSLEVTPAILEYGLHQLKEGPIQSLEFSWMLEDNPRIVAVVKALGARPSRTHRLYERPAPG